MPRHDTHRVAVGPAPLQRNRPAVTPPAVNLLEPVEVDVLGVANVVEFVDDTERDLHANVVR